MPYRPTELPPDLTPVPEDETPVDEMQPVTQAQFTTFLNTYPPAIYLQDPYDVPVTPETTLRFEDYYEVREMASQESDQEADATTETPIARTVRRGPTYHPYQPQDRHPNESRRRVGRMAGIRLLSSGRWRRLMLISLIVTIAIVGLIVWLITTYVPMPPVFRTVILVISGVGLLLYCLQVLGLWSGTTHPILR